MVKIPQTHVMTRYDVLVSDTVITAVVDPVVTIHLGQIHHPLKITFVEPVKIPHRFPPQTIDINRETDITGGDIGLLVGLLALGDPYIRHGG